MRFPLEASSGPGSAGPGRVLLLSLALVMSLPCPAAMAIEILAPGAPPRAGEPMSIRFSSLEEGAHGLHLQATWQPSSVVESSLDLGPLPASGKILWTPNRAGILRLEVVGPSSAILATRDLGVHYRRLPPEGLAVLLLAGGLLGSAIVQGLRQQLFS